MNGNGSISAGYDDDYSNVAASDHGIVFGGTANLFGSYYNPKFLSFDIQPFYNQSRENSTFQSLTDSSGVNASAQFFSGSPYGGSVNYSTSFNSSGNFNVPGLADYTTHGNNNLLTLNWGVHRNDFPTINFTFSDAGSDYSIYGINTRGTAHSDTFSVTSGYQVEGFNLTGGYQYGNTRNHTPEFLAGEGAQQGTSNDNSFFFGVGHKLPWNGSISAAATRMNLDTDLGDTISSDHYNTTVDTMTGAIYFAPRPHLNVGGNAYYTDNLEGTLLNTLVTSGVTVPETEGRLSSNALSLTGYANYELPAQHLNLDGFVQRQQQSYLGIEFATDSVNGTAMYTNRLLGGVFSGVLGVTETLVSTTNQNLLGLNTSINYTHQIHQWAAAGSFRYSQDTQTVLIAYTTSGYNYTASLGRRIRRRSYWGIYAGGSRSLLTGQPGSATSSQSYSSSLSMARFSINGSYSESSGNALLTSTGLVATPVPLPIINPADVVLYNGKSYSVGLGATPFHGLVLSANYAQALSSTLSNSTTSDNNNKNLNFLMTYNVRKLGFIAGYSRLVQGFSFTGGPPTLAGSFYVGITRSFNFF